MDTKFELYTKEELKLFRNRDILRIYDEVSLVKFIAEEILNIKITFEFSQRLGFEYANKEFAQRINDSGFTSLFKTAIKENYIKPYKTGILKIEESQKELLFMYGEIASFREKLQELRLKNQIETRNNFDFQKLLSYLLKQVNKLEKYLLTNHPIDKQTNNNSQENNSTTIQQVDDLNFIVFIKKQPFREIEKALIEKGYIDDKLVWKKDTATFLRFFNLLIDNTYISSSSKYKQKEGLEHLSKRYNFTLSKKSKTPSRVSEYLDYQKEFSFLEISTPEKKKEHKPYGFS